LKQGLVSRLLPLDLLLQRRNLVDLQHIPAQAHVVIKNATENLDRKRLVGMDKGDMNDSGIFDRLDLEATPQHAQSGDFGRQFLRKQLMHPKPINEAVFRIRTAGSLSTQEPFQVDAPD